MKVRFHRSYDVAMRTLRSASSRSTPWRRILGGAGAVLALSLVTATPAVEAQERGAAPYAGVKWAGLTYPGLSGVCPGAIQPSFNPILIGKVELVHVNDRATALALVVAGCNLNHFDANLYAFSPGKTQGQATLVQRLALYQGSVQFVRLTSSPNLVAMQVAGFTPGEGLCCPSVFTIRRWTWVGSKFAQLPTIRLHSRP
jgi:hypothetical protein